MEQQKSNFITITAWLFIIGTGFASFMAVMQNVMFHIMFKDEDFSNAPVPEEAPSIFRLFFENPQLFFIIFLIICIAMFVSSVGLLKRKNWARIVFICFLIKISIQSQNWR